MTTNRKILIDIGHPAHVHLFRNLIFYLQKQQHKVIVITKRVPSIIRLLELYGISYIIIGRKSESLFLKYFNQIYFILKTCLIAKRNKIDVCIGVSMTIPMVTRLTGIASIGLDDDDMTITPIFAKFINQSSIVLTPDCLAYENRGMNHLTYPGYKELAYLHPLRFKFDPSVLNEIGINQEQMFFVLRFNAFKAHHDLGASGISIENKKRLINLLLKYGKVLISTEKEIESEFKLYQLKCPPDKIHNLLFAATLFISDSQTMTSEAAVLGTPALKCNTFAGKISVPNEIENKYGLCFSYQPEEFDNLLRKVEELLSIPDLKVNWERKRLIMLRDKIDVSGFLSWFVEQYPSGVTEIRKKSDFFDNFRYQYD